MDTLSPPPSGHNRPPAVDPEKLADIKGRIDQFMAASTQIRDAFKETPLRNEEQAKRLADHITALRGLNKQIEEARVEAKKPFDEGAKEVQGTFKPLADRVTKALDIMLSIMGDFLTWKADQERRRQEEQRASAAEAQRQADEAARAAAASGNIDAEVEAERLINEAADLTKEAERDRKVNVGSATGAGRTVAAVTVRTAKLREPKAVALSQLFLFYRDRPEVEELLLRLANADIRAKDVDESKIPGIDIDEKLSAR